MLLYYFCQRQTDGFSIARIRSDLEPRSEWETPSSADFADILNQPFRYLGKGVQTFAFASADGRYVLKFYRHHRAGHPLSFFSPISPRLKMTLAKRQNKRLKDFSSYKLGYDHLKEETGLIFIHLNRGDFHQKVTLYDKIGIKHILDLNEMEFLLQQRAQPFYTALERWIDDGQLEEAKEGITGLLSLLQSRCLKGISDKDPDLQTNFGFINQRPIQFDVGRFKLDSSIDTEAELIRITAKLKDWLDQKSPHLSQHLQKELEKPF